MKNIKQDIEDMKAFSKTLDTKEKSITFLVATGIYNEDGTFTEPYRDEHIEIVVKKENKMSKKGSDDGSLNKPNKKTKDAMKEARDMEKEKSDINILNQNEIDALLDLLDGKKCKKIKERKPTGKLDKETFIIIMNLIIEQDKMNNHIGKALEIMSDSWVMLDMDKFTRKAIWKIMEIFFNDYEIDNLQWWLYEDVEKIFYENDKNGKCIKKYPVKTLEQLYDYMILWRKKK
jgi:hypothetical protein